ncbi:MAG: hypothetical protein IT493_00925 [Gammaproteobacteria bacterium]|nr:hypothetical protein [Gammaproteobacteria bacterium]
MKAELLYGACLAADMPAPRTRIDATHSDDVVLENVQVHYALFEVPMAAALACLPVSLHPAVPAHLGLTFWRCDGGPLGAFECAWIGLACRTGIKPRHLVHAAFVDRADVGDWLARRYGFDCRVADVHYRETYDRLQGRIVIDGQVLLDTVTTRMQPVVGAGASVKYSPALNATRVGDAALMVQMETAYAFKRVIRGTPQLPVYDAAALGNAQLVATFPMSGTHAVVDITLLPPRFTADFAVPAESGGAKKIAR